ncbi:uncharacterized protein BDW70DRAFT_144676 [Aspergillus foveolatus]|uniref:uncharacterized protein n=1 Tax=Aspergillus foveolatus TaxID=210207 RepID=UPI003CCDE42D
MLCSRARQAHTLSPSPRPRYLGSESFWNISGYCWVLILVGSFWDYNEPNLDRDSGFNLFDSKGRRLL